MKLSIYKTLLTNRRTMLVGSKGKIGSKEYREVHIIREAGKFHFRITDGYNWLLVKTGYSQGLKTVLNIAEGYMTKV
jgi:hypothetical protein